VLSAATLLELGYRDVVALAGGTEAWRKDGRPLETGLSGVLRAPDDVGPAGPDRSFADMINYLRWEERLGHKYAR
jgi:3-mercaptopyruvate sulfurtransferase SseA